MDYRAAEAILDFIRVPSDNIQQRGPMGEESGVLILISAAPYLVDPIINFTTKFNSRSNYFIVVAIESSLFVCSTRVKHSSTNSSSHQTQLARVIE